MINNTDAREARRVVRRVARIQAIRQAPLLNKAHDQHVDGLRSTADIYEDRINYAALLAAKAALRADPAARGAKLRPSTRPSSSASGSRQCPPLPRIWPLSMVPACRVPSGRRPDRAQGRGEKGRGKTYPANSAGECARRQRQLAKAA